MTLESIVNRKNTASKRFFVHKVLPNLNDYTKATRSKINASAGMKKKTEKVIMKEAVEQLGGWKTDKPVFIIFRWVEKNKRRDHDNVAFAKKFILDALVKAGILKGDGWKHVTGFLDTFDIDEENPGVEVCIVEVGDEQ